MSAVKRSLLGLGLALFVAAACDDAPALPTDHATRQRSLAERIVGWARHARKLPADQVESDGGH